MSSKEQPAEAGDQPTAPRSKGRPAKDGATVGREEIIRATGELLHTLPLGKVTSAEVARRVGVHPALINYYFKNRSELLAATALELMKVSPEGEFLQPGLDMRRGLKARISALLKVHRSQPFLHRIIVDELVHSRTPANMDAFRERTLAGVGRYSRYLQRWAGEGMLKATPAAFFYIAVIGMCEFYTAAQPILDNAGAPGVDEGRDAAYIDFICDMVLDGLRPREGSCLSE